MARGWESKAVEDQIDNAQADRDARNETEASSAGDRERERQRQSLLLSRTRTVALLESASNERYRKQLERGLAHLDEQLKELE